MTPAARLDATFTALADPTRRAILARLAEGEASVMELAAPFAISQPAISKHLKMLERAGLVSRGRDAQRRPVKLESKSLAGAADWLERFREAMESNYRRLDALLEELQSSTEEEAPLTKQAQQGVAKMNRRSSHVCGSTAKRRRQRNSTSHSSPTPASTQSPATARKVMTLTSVPPAPS